MSISRRLSALEEAKVLRLTEPRASTHNYTMRADEIIRRIEPGLETDHGAVEVYLSSIAISLKRIADHLRGLNDNG